MNDIMKLLKTTAKNLEKNNIKTYIVDNKDGVADLIKKLIKKGDTVSNGGSESLKQCGIINILNSGDYNYIDRTKLEPKEAYIKAFSADAYFCSSNAITENGELYNVDGNSNRIAAIAYGPDSVIMVVGYNKIVKNIDEAINRVKTICAPNNCRRLEVNSYCNSKGQCMSYLNENPEICDGCNSDTRICCNYFISARQRHKDRIKVILVPEVLGY